MERNSFIQLLTTLTHDQLNQYIKDHGKCKEDEVYDCPWTIDLSRCEQHPSDNRNDNHKQQQ